MPSIAVIVPTLNEEEAVSRTLAELTGLGAPVLVSDGGSRDRTLDCVRRTGVRVVSGNAGRGPQLNRGAAAVEAEILLFVHADTVLPPNALSLVEEAVAGGTVGGGFAIRFDSSRPIMRLGAWLINQRTRWTRLPLGDQAQFVTREAFDAIDGFREWPILEDIDFIRRLKSQGSIAVIGTPVTTAARRFLTRGILRTIATNWLIWTLYLFGVSPHRLAHLYRQVR